MFRFESRIFRSSIYRRGKTARDFIKAHEIFLYSENKMSGVYTVTRYGAKSEKPQKPFKPSRCMLFTYSEYYATEKNVYIMNIFLTVFKFKKQQQFVVSSCSWLLLFSVQTVINVYLAKKKKTMTYGNFYF